MEQFLWSSLCGGDRTVFNVNSRGTCTESGYLDDADGFPGEVVSRVEEEGEHEDEAAIPAKTWKQEQKHLNLTRRKYQQYEHFNTKRNICMSVIYKQMIKLKSLNLCVVRNHQVCLGIFANSI